MADVLFNLRSNARALLGGGVTLDQTRVHQQVDFEETTQLMYVTQVIANGVKLPDESAPPATNVRDARGDIAINRVTPDGRVTGVMYCRRFDHGSGIGVEYDAATGTTWLWLAYDAAEQTPGTNAHGRRIVRLPFVPGDIVDVGRAGLDIYNPIPDAQSITPGLDLAHGRMGIAYNTGSGGTKYAVYDLARFKAKDFSAPLYAFDRPSYPDFQSWTLYGDYIYQHHGTGYSAAGGSNPPPPDGSGNTWFTVVDVRTGSAVDRVQNFFALDLEYREPESVSVWETATGPQLVFGFAAGPTPRRMALYGVSATVDTSLALRAEAVTAPQEGVQLTVSIREPETLRAWSIDRYVSGVAQRLFAGSGSSLPAVSTWMDTAPPGCVPLTYVLTLERTTGEETTTSEPVTYVPAGGCAPGGPAVGEQDNALGCAQTYTAQIHWRGGALPYPSGAMERLTAVKWSRTWNDVSDASVTVLKGDVSDECCEALSVVEPWVHELTLYRDGELVWQGPVTRTVARRDSIVIEAQDVSAWLDHLVNTFRITYTTAVADARGRKAGPITQIAANHIRLNLLESSLSVPADYPGIVDYMVVRDGGLPTVKVEKDGSSDTAVWGAYMGAILREWAKRGLTWTAVGRALLLRGRPTSSTLPTARLTMEDFVGEIEVIKDGAEAGTYGFATTQDQQNISEGKTLGTGRTGTAYGRLDRLVEVDEEKPKDEDLRQAAREAIAGRYPVPTAVSVPDGAGLAPTAPVRVRQLVPGERIDVLAVAFCAPVLQGFALTDVEGSWDSTGGTEKIAVSLIPLADVDEELGS